MQGVEKPNQIIISINYNQTIININKINAVLTRFWFILKNSRICDLFYTQSRFEIGFGF